MFRIEKTTTGNFYHVYNNERTRVNISDFDVVIDDVASTFIIQCKNGSNVPSQAIGLNNVQVVDLNISTDPIPFSGADGLIELLKSLDYTPYLSEPTEPIVIYRKGQVGVFKVTQTWIDENFDETGLGINQAIGWAKRNGNNGTSNMQGRFSLNQGAEPYDVIGDIGGSADAVLVAHSHTVATYAGNLPDSQRISSSSITDIGGNKTSTEGESAEGKNMPPFLIDLWLERVTDLIFYGGSPEPIGDFLPLAGGTMDAGADIAFANGSAISEGTTDAGEGGAKGIALKCSVQYEKKWEAGREFIMESDGFTIREKLHNFNNIPDANQDETKGFVVGSMWVLDNGEKYKCIDATEGAAVWVYQNGDLNLEYSNGSGVENYLLTIDYLNKRTLFNGLPLSTLDIPNDNTIPLQSSFEFTTSIESGLLLRFIHEGTTIVLNGVLYESNFYGLFRYKIYPTETYRLKKQYYTDFPQESVWYLDRIAGERPDFEFQFTQIDDDAPQIVEGTLKGARGATITPTRDSFSEMIFTSDLPIFADVKDCYKGETTRASSTIMDSSGNIYLYNYHCPTDYILFVTMWQLDAGFPIQAEGWATAPIFLKLEYK